MISSKPLVFNATYMMMTPTCVPPLQLCLLSPCTQPPIYHHHLDVGITTSMCLKWIYRLPSRLASPCGFLARGGDTPSSPMSPSVTLLHCSVLLCTCNKLGFSSLLRVGDGQSSFLSQWLFPLCLANFHLTFRLQLKCLLQKRTFWNEYKMS